MKLKEFVGIVRIVIVTLLFIVLIGEGMVRVFGPVSVDTCGFFVSDSVNRFAIKPNYSAVLASSEYSVSVSTDSLGYRNSPDKFFENASQKILFLGDSFTFGLGVSDKETFSSLVEQAIHTNGRSGVVYNAGVIGHGTINEYNDLLRIAPIFKPDIVVLVYFANDPSDNSLLDEFDVYDGCLVFRNESNKELKNNLRRYFQSYNFLSHYLRGVFQTAESAEEVDAVATVKVMRELVNYSDSINAETIIVLIPTSAGVTWLEESDLTNLRVINMRGVLNKENYFSWDGHLKPSGHEVVARAIIEELYN